jgi:hypothetical protein
MATIKLPESTDEKIILAIDNGDLKALKDILEKFSIKDESSFFRYALGIFTKADTAEVKIKEDGKEVVASPSASLLDIKKQAEKSEVQTQLND